MSRTWDEMRQENREKAARLETSIDRLGKPQKKMWCAVHDQPAMQDPRSSRCRYWWAHGECDIRVAWLYLDVSLELQEVWVDPDGSRYSHPQPQYVDPPIRQTRFVSPWVAE